MGERNYDHPWALGKKVRIVAASFAPNGASQPVAADIRGKGVASIVRNTAGNFTVTLRDKYRHLRASAAQVRSLAAVDLVAQFGAFSNVGSTTGQPVSFVIRLLAGAVETDMSANADNRVSFWLFFDDSDV